MTYYRLYLLDSKGGFASLVDFECNDFECDDDVAAVSTAQARFGGLAMELWVRDRLVEELSASRQRRPARRGLAGEGFGAPPHINATLP